MTLQQLERLIKIPGYSLSDKQLEELNKLRNDNFNEKHDFRVHKHSTDLNIDKPQIEDPS